MKNLIHFALIFLISCSIVPSNKSKRSVTGSPAQSGNYNSNPVTDNLIIKEDKNILSITDADNKLASEADRFIKLNKLSESGYVPDKQFNTISKRPVISVTEPEMDRLKAAWASSGEAHNVLARRFKRADEEIAAGLTFPPEGGQHNQWYQCDSCQRGLTTIDAHHHQCPSCNRIYSGFPFDNVLYNRHHSRNIRSAEDAAWAWAVTGEKRYADFAAAVLTGYAERYLKYPMVHAGVNDKTIDIGAEKTGRYKSAGHMQPQTLDESNTMIPAVIAYDLIYNTLSQLQKQNIEKNFLRAMAESINVHKTGKSNWQTWHNAALLYAGAVLGDGAMIRQALLDDKNGFTAQMKISVLPEGMWYENSWGYHYYTLSAMTHIAEGARRLGIDVYHYPALRNMYLIAFDYLMNDGSLPRFGDAVQDSPSRQGVNEKAWAVYKDDRLLASLPSELSWDAIVLGRDITQESPPLKAVSKLISGAGHAILATDGPGKLTAAISFGPYGGFHGHFDKLSFVFFGYGEELGVDPGRAASQAYRLPIHRDWYKSSTGHNVILVDGNSQKEAEGKCLAFTSTSSYAAITADAGPALGNVSHVRFMLLTPGYLLVIDELKNNDGLDHTYDWLYHNKGKHILCSLPSSDRIIDKIPAGYAYLRDITAHSSDKLQSIPVTISGESVKVYLTMAGEEGDEVYTATGPFSSTADRAPVVILRRKGQTVRFAAVLEPAESAGRQAVKKLTLTTSPVLSVSVARGDSEDRVLFPAQRLDNFIVQQKTSSGSETVLKN